MTTADLLYQKAQLMPENLREEALHYMDYLLQKWQKPATVTANNSIKMPVTLDEKQQQRKELSKIMHEIAKQGTVFSRENIDVMEWQREVRQDRVLVGREAD